MNTSLYLRLFEIFNNRIAYILRISVWIGLIFLFYLVSLGIIELKFTVMLFLFFGINETFIHFRINKLTAEKTVHESNQNYLLSLMPRERIWWNHATDAYQLAMLYSHKPECRHMIHKLNAEFSLQRTDIPKDELLKTAGILVEKTNGLYIHALDLLAAYLLLTESQSKSLHHFNIKREEFISLYYWLRNHYQIDAPHFQPLHFSGAGVFDFFIYGWDTQIKQYADNLTHRILVEKYRPIITGREKTYEQLLGALSKDNAGNVLLIGDPGVGKASLVQYFASESYDGVIPAKLNHIVVYELLVDRILAGVQNQGELEERLLYVLSEIVHSGNVVVYIPNIENIFGGGGFNFDLSGVLFEYLKNDAIKIIGATTQQAYSQTIENKESIAALFEPLIIEEPSEDITIHMLLQRVGELEHQHHISIDFSAVKESVVLAKSYAPQRKFPGVTFDLLQTTIAQIELVKKHTVTGEDVQTVVEKKANILIKEPTKNEKQLLIHLEDEIHKRMVNQEQAVKAVASAMRRLRSGFVNEKRPIGVFLFLGPTGVGKTEMAKALAEIYFQDETNMLRYDMTEFKTEDGINRLLGEAPGHAYIPHSLTEEITKKPFSVVLLDEFEKANPHIHDIFLQAFDEGRLTSNKGETVSLRQAIIIATSNAGSEFIREKLNEGHNSHDLHAQLLEYLLASKEFKPELINRFDDVIVFTPLSPVHITQIAAMTLAKALKKLEDQELYIDFDESVPRSIAENAYSQEFGARNIRRYIQDTIEDVISTWILEDKIEKSTKYTISISEQNELQLVKNS